MCSGGPKPAGSSASSNVNEPLVSSRDAFTDMRNPPRSIDLPPPGPRTNAWLTSAPHGHLSTGGRLARRARWSAPVPRAARLLGTAYRFDDQTRGHVGIGVGVRTTVLDVARLIPRDLPRDPHGFPPVAHAVTELFV